LGRIFATLAARAELPGDLSIDSTIETTMVEAAS